MKDWLTRLYPKGWRDRYAAEFRALLDDHPPGPLDVLDILLNAGRERMMRSAAFKTTGIRLGGLLACLSLLLLVGGFAARQEDTAEFLVILSPLVAVLTWPALLRLADTRWQPLAYGMVGVLALSLLLTSVVPGTGGQAGLTILMGAIGVYGLAAAAAAWLVWAKLPIPAAPLTALAACASIGLSATQLLYQAGLTGVGVVGAGVLTWGVSHLAWTTATAVILLIHTPADLAAPPA
jgi:hypothetical protein